MTFKDLILKKAYSSDEDNILFDFYIPVLEKAVKYDRLAGFFSSSSLAVSAKGIIPFIKNDGQMRLIACPRLMEQDIKIILTSQVNQDEYIEAILISELEKAENEFVKDHVKALGWMVASNRLEIKIAVVYDDDGKLLSAEEINERGIFHQKVGIFYDDENNLVTFSGSVNETAAGWLNNIEEFKVFRGWNELEYEYIKPDLDKFERIWNGNSKRIKINDVSSAVKNKLVEMAPDNIDTINWKKYYKQKKAHKLYDYQKDAVNNWLKNNKIGLFEMATGTGKTFTALACYDVLSSQCNKLVTVITSPKNHLVQQWKKEVKNFGIETEYLIADGTNREWRAELYKSLADIQIGYHSKIIIFTTHKTFSSTNFQRTFEEFIDKIDTFLIADEVHGVGAEKSSLGLKIPYKYRLGLSATPKRWFDFEGTNKLYSYFGGDPIYKFPLEDAIYSINPATGLTYLTPFKYNIKFADLNDNELSQYIKLTKRIVKMQSIKSKDMQEVLKLLNFIRADIVKDANNKIEQLENILDEMTDYRWTIIYCSPKQIDDVMKQLNRRGIICHRFTMKQGTEPSLEYNGLSEREHILKLFAEGKYEILVSMHCLDEGVDVPPARKAIFMSSSGNPREYIQRIGRVIRRFPGKTEANIFDIIVKPRLEDLPDNLSKLEKVNFSNQISRCKEIAKISLNNTEAIKTLNSTIN